MSNSFTQIIDEHTIKIINNIPTAELFKDNLKNGLDNETIEKKRREKHNLWLRSYMKAWMSFYSKSMEKISELLEQILHNNTIYSLNKKFLDHNYLKFSWYSQKINFEKIKQDGSNFTFKYWDLHRNSFKIDEDRINPETFWSKYESFGSVFERIKKELLEKGYYFEEIVPMETVREHWIYLSNPNEYN